MSDCYQLEEASAPWMAGHPAAAPGIPWRPALLGEEILDLLAGESGEHLLDIGCLRQGVLTAAIRRGLPATGLEFTPEAAVFSKKTEPESEVVVGSLPEIPFGAETFHLVTCLELPLEVENSPAFFGELQRVLKPEGRLCIVLPNAHHIRRPDADSKSSSVSALALARADWERQLWSNGLDAYHVRPDWSLDQERAQTPAARKFEAAARFFRRHLYELAPAIVVPRYVFFCRRQ